MKSNTKETKQKRVFLKSCLTFQQIEEVIKIILLQQNKNLQISIIGKLNDSSFKNEKKRIAIENKMKEKCNALFTHPIDFGILSNSEIGSIFITGFLASMFFQKVEQKKIGEMLSGPYGILRGVGIGQESATLSLKKLHLGNYLLILRGFDSETENQLKSLLKEE